MIWWISCHQIVTLKPNPDSHCQRGPCSKHPDMEKMLIWQPAPTLKASVNIAPKSKRSHIHSSSAAAICVILWNQDFDICLIWVQTSSFHTVLYHPTVKKKTKNFGFAGDDVELCYPLHIIPPVKCLLGGLYWIFWGGGKTANLALKIQITQFRMKECEIHVCLRLRAESVWGSLVAYYSIGRVISEPLLVLFHHTLQNYPPLPLKTGITSCFPSAEKQSFCMMSNVFCHPFFLKNINVVKSLPPTLFSNVDSHGSRIIPLQPPEEGGDNKDQLFFFFCLKLKQCLVQVLPWVIWG